jgi:hypothetical protein
LGSQRKRRTSTFRLSLLLLFLFLFQAMTIEDNDLKRRELGAMCDLFRELSSRVPCLMGFGRVEKDGKLVACLYINKNGNCFASDLAFMTKYFGHIPLVETTRDGAIESARAQRSS